MNHKKLSQILMLIILFQSCMTSARISDFPRSADLYDFNKIANAKETYQPGMWNSKTGYGYFLKTNISDDSIIINAITTALKVEHFTIKYIDKNKGSILAERGLRANEWKAVSGVYYQKSNEGADIYIKCKISQDVTGGWREDRAKQIGQGICHNLHGCLQSYSVNNGVIDLLNK